jgi:hypothetical protein
VIFDFINKHWNSEFGPLNLVVLCFLGFGVYGGQAAAIDNKSANPSTWIVGKWKMVTVLEGNQDVTPLMNPENDRWIEFKADGTFVSGGKSQGTNTGSYQVNNNEKILRLDSDAGEEDDSNWRLQFREDLLYMRGIGSQRQEMTTVISQRVH